MSMKIHATSHVVSAREQELTRLLIQKTAMFSLPEGAYYVEGRIVLPDEEIDYPAAYWDDDIACWCVLKRESGPDHIDTFLPFSDMNDAWLVLRHAVLGRPDHLCSRGLLTIGLFGTASYPTSREFALGTIIAWTPEMITLAVLRAYGVNGV